MIRIYTAFVCCFLMIFNTTEATATSLKSSQKQKIIAAAVYRIIKFVDWNETLLTTETSFNLCLQRADLAFEPITKRQIKGRNIQIILLEGEKQTVHCHALYLNGKQILDYEKLLASVKNRAVLTISEQMGFIQQGGMIELGNKNNRLVFSINQNSAKKSGLNISYQLLALAQHVIEN